MLRVIQTSSSHEPFEVPYSAPFPDKRAVAFAYTDKCLGEFIRFLKSDSSRWEQSLVVLVPDHYGAYPRDLSDRCSATAYLWCSPEGSIPCSTDADNDACITKRYCRHTTFTIRHRPLTVPLSHDMLQPGAPQYAFFFRTRFRGNGDRQWITCRDINTKRGNHKRQ